MSNLGIPKWIYEPSLIDIVNMVDLGNILNTYNYLIICAISIIPPSIMLMYGLIGLVTKSDPPIKNHLRNSILFGILTPLLALLFAIIMVEMG